MSAEHRTKCPYCRVENPLVSDVADLADGQALPEDGDVSVCFTCAEFSIFDSHHPDGLRRATRKEAEEVLTDQDVLAVIAGIMRVNTDVDVAGLRLGM